MMFVKKIIEERLATSILSMSPLSGGDINQVLRIETINGHYVVKYNDREKFPGMLAKEARGLKLILKNGFNTPHVIDTFTDRAYQFLILDYIEPGKPSKKFWNRFANQLSLLHQNSNDYFGLDHNNYIGSLPQENDEKTTWEAFFVQKRLEPLINTAFDKGLLTSNHLRSFEHLFTLLKDVIPIEQPALLHGDLWSGNILCAKDQEPVLIDPAVYYGHREVDIAMTRMFGGFDPLFLEYYNEQYPLEKGWERRLPIHNLYPNLVHLILFGSSYLGGIERVLKSFD